MIISSIIFFAGIVQTGWSQCPEPDGYFPDTRQCDRYFICREGVISEGLCPDGLAFNDKTSYLSPRCDFVLDVDCSTRPELQPAQPSEHCPHQWGDYPHETDCGKFWKCAEGVAYGFDCPVGLAYNLNKRACDWPDLVPECDSEAFLGFKCPVPTPAEIQLFANPLYPHPTDCKKLFVCVIDINDPSRSRRLPRLLACEDYLVFNPIKSSCDAPVNVTGCENYYENFVKQTF
ncbi:protein obstructor-E-like [Limulus polyphemus]|uniref:Protein obstructor-E-like n=1 Tax=Limulus polyphemus TaxID=6850 RepID=A0ABM1T0Z3_LIMPO|nr:protein obstructor-E-like [Limulus polyphemus]